MLSILGKLNDVLSKTLVDKTNNDATTKHNKNIKVVIKFLSSI